MKWLITSYSDLIGVLPMMISFRIIMFVLYQRLTLATEMQ